MNKTIKILYKQQQSSCVMQELRSLIAISAAVFLVTSAVVFQNGFACRRNSALLSGAASSALVDSSNSNPPGNRMKVSYSSLLIDREL